MPAFCLRNVNSTSVSYRIVGGRKPPISFELQTARKLPYISVLTRLDYPLCCARCSVTDDQSRPLRGVLHGYTVNAVILFIGCSATRSPLESQIRPVKLQPLNGDHSHGIVDFSSTDQLVSLFAAKGDHENVFVFIVKTVNSVKV